jgi:hypothetical protein
MGRARFLAPALLIAAAALTASAAPATDRPDLLTSEVSRSAAFLRTHTASDDLWKQIKDGTGPVLDRVQKALADGHRLLALLRYASVQEGVTAATYIAERTAAQRQDAAAFEAEWKRMGGVLREERGAPAARALEGVSPAAVRAMGEAVLPQVRVYYDASLDYGRSTTPDSGLYYLGAAQSARDYVRLARRLSEPTRQAAPPVRSIAGELDALEAEMLAAYRPPLSIDKHREFIGASSALKEARELEAAGLRYGALLRYLQAVLRFASLRLSPLPPQDADGRLRALEARLNDARTDHTIGRVFAEAARSDLAEHAQDGAAVAATAVVSDVLPRYFAALDKAAPRAARVEPRVTVTLVRWPYT